MEMDRIRLGKARSNCNIRTDWRNRIQNRADIDELLQMLPRVVRLNHTQRV